MNPIPANLKFHKLTPTERVELKNALDRITVHQVWRLLGLEGYQDVPKDGADYVGCSPWRDDAKASLSLFDNGRRWKDHGLGEDVHGDSVDFLTVALNVPREIASRLVIGLANGEPSSNTESEGFYSPFDDLKKTERRASEWPAMETPTEAEIASIATGRGLSVDGVTLAARRGFIYCCESKEGRAWVVAERACDPEGFYHCFYLAQARRLDGKPWGRLEGRKAWTLPGSIATCPIGIHAASLYDPSRKGPRYAKLLLVEGGPDFLTAFDLISMMGLEETVHPIAMLGAGMSIDASVLPKFGSTRVKILPHLDAAGAAAGQRWFDQLNEIATSVTGYSFEGLGQPEAPVTDLNDFAKLINIAKPEDLVETQTLLQELFKF